MKTRLILVMSLFMLQACTGLPKKTNQYFKIEEENILAKTTAAIGYDYGYDTKLEINYIYRLESSAERKNMQKFNSELKKLKLNDLKVFYVKILKLYESHQYLLKYARKTKKWTVYNHIKNQTIVPVETYFNLISKAFEARSRSLYKKVNKKKMKYKQEVILMYQTKHNIVDEY